MCGAVRIEGGWVATQRPVNCSLLCMCIVMGVAHHALKSHSVEVLGPVVPEDVGCAVGAGSTPVLDLRHLKHRRMVRETYFKDLLNVFHFSHITKALYGLINSANKHIFQRHKSSGTTDISINLKSCIIKTVINTLKGQSFAK